MSTKKLKLKIITPEKLILEEMVDQVTIPTTEGEITVLPEHIPLIAPLKSGEIVAMLNGEYIPMAVVGGFVEVKNTPPRPLGTPPPKGGDETPRLEKEGAGGGMTEVIVLADFAEHVADITDLKIAEAKARAEELAKLAENKDHVDFEHFESELERSLTRIKIADKWRSKKYRR